ncbi:hypothetical protein ACIPSA_47815 [Streptomyces sp. NPDC086549]|uniref:hypothetical protein n=1 Tax=Streptomyces sp. NPDC086549 TaxID=3365752 RepID=UPI003810AAFF
MGQDHRDLLVPAHIQLGGPVVVVWDLDPVEGIWSLPRRTVTVNMVFADRAHLVRAVRSGMSGALPAAGVLTPEAVRRVSRVA